MPSIHVYPQKSQKTDHTVEINAIIKSNAGQNLLWYRVPQEYSPCITDSANPFVIAMVFFAMKNGVDLRVHGTVSPSLLQNLEEFQTAWNCWNPDRYQIIEVHANEEKEEECAKTDMTLATFSGGLDSCFSVWRHTKGDCGRRKRNLKAALMVHGFDIPLNEVDIFSRAAENSRKIVNSAGLEFIPIACNVRELGDDWEEEHGAALASCLSLFSKRYSAGLIASSHVYNALRFPWGSNPLTDPMLSSNSFSIIYDSAEFSRPQKAKRISEWEEAMKRLRVCWEGEHNDRNCGGCSRCIITALCFAVNDIRPPAVLNVPSLEKCIKRLKTLLLKPAAITRYGEIVTAAKDIGIQASWVGSLEQCVQQKRCAQNSKLEKLRLRISKLYRKIGEYVGA